MMHRKKMCRNICIYFIITLIAFASICMLLISKEGRLPSSNTVYDTVRLPLKDSLDRNLGKKLTSKMIVLNFKQNRSVVASGSKQDEKHKVVVQIDKLILSLIEQIEQRDNSIKDEIKLQGITNYTCRQKPRVVKEVEDLLCMRPPKFLPQYKNPCWNTSKGNFHCLPFFQVIGMDKCGSTDLFDRIAKHPDVLKNGGVLEKETMWWSWRRYGHWLRHSIKPESFEQYTHFFDKAAKTIQLKPSSGLITGDGTPMDIWDMSGWVSIPQNSGLREPEFITPHLIQHVNPRVKLIIILRDPIERLFSDYFFLKLGKLSIKGFHEEVIRSIKLLHMCTRKFTFRACLYSRNLHMKLNARIHLGFYSLFLQDWLKVFPREQFLILRTEDYSNRTADHLKQVFDFLGLRNLPQSNIEKFASTERKYVTKSKKLAGKMLPQTRVVLERLYKKYNKKLADILNDKRFLWTKES